MEPNKDVPTYPGVVDLGAVGPVIDTHRRIEPPTAAKPKWARRELPMPCTLEYQRWRSEIDARPGKLEEDRCAFGAASQGGKWGGGGGWPLTPEAVLMDMVVRLQRDVEAMKTGPQLGILTLGGPASPARSKLVMFTSTKVPRFAGVTSWEQYHQYRRPYSCHTTVVSPGGRCTERSIRTGLVGALFEKTGRKGVEDPSIFVTALETLAVKAFGDMGQVAPA